MEITVLSTRTTQTTVRFASPFLLPGLDEPQPAGEYRVDHDEEAIEGVSHLAWRRVCTFIHLPAIGAPATLRQMLPVNPADLEAALAKDQQPS